MNSTFIINKIAFDEDCGIVNSGSISPPKNLIDLKELDYACSRLSKEIGNCNIGVYHESAKRISGVIKPLVNYLKESGQPSTRTIIKLNEEYNLVISIVDLSYKDSDSLSSDYLREGWDKFFTTSYVNLCTNQLITINLSEQQMECPNCA